MNRKSKRGLASPSGSPGSKVEQNRIWTGTLAKMAEVCVHSKIQIVICSFA